MKVCPHCHYDLPDDAIFCTSCGKPLDKNVQHVTEVKTQSGHVREVPKLKKNPKVNNFGKLGAILFFTGLFGLDFVIATVVQNIFGNATIVFYISMIFYILAIICGVTCLVVDHKDKKKGFEPSGTMAFAVLAIIMSFYTILLNLNNIILK